ncbi:MAG: SPFH domain-containing protein, partial [Flavobacterium sp.]
MTPMYFIIGAIIVLLLLGFFTVKQQSAVIIERFGRFNSIRHSGLQIK